MSTQSGKTALRQHDNADAAARRLVVIGVTSFAAAVTLTLLPLWLRRRKRNKKR